MVLNYFEQLLDQKRQRLAESMLAHEGIPVAEIAAAQGYSTPANFNWAFTRWRGMSPTAWQASQPAAANHQF